MLSIGKEEKILLGGRILTNMGDSMFFMMVLWYFNEEFSSPMLLSLVFAISSLIDMLSFLLGPIVDRTSAKWNLFLVSMLQTVSVFLLWILINFLNKDISSFLLLFCLIIVYTISMIIYPSGEKLIPVFAKEKDLLKVNSLFQTSEKVLDILFNAVSTILISFLGFNIILMFVILFLGIATKLYQVVSISVEKIGNIESNNNLERGYSFCRYINDLSDGIKEMKSHSEILKLFLPLSISNLFYGIAIVGLPIISQVYISTQAYGYGTLLMSSSLGGMLGAILIGKFESSIQNPRKYACAFLMIAGVAWTLIPITMPKYFLISYICIFISNCAINMMNVMFISLMQKQIEQSLLGRVSTFTESLVSIMIPFGNMLGGFLLVHCSVLFVVILYGVALMLCGITYLCVGR